MLKFWRNGVQKQLNNEAPASGTQEQAMRRMRNRIFWQAGLAVLTIVLTIIIVFGMTAAWYTNVVQSSGLIFQVEEYGLDVDAAVYSATFVAAPGDEGIISFEAANTGSGTVMVTVNTSTVNLDAEGEMQKRLFFFVDDQETVNGETVQRVYLNSQRYYDYLVFEGGKLTLTEGYHNDVQLKWHWVYDVLGYYVLAQVAEDGTITVTEYLQPIEYDYDSATFTYETVESAEGDTEEATQVKVLATVDGVTTPEEFLVQTSATDGYEGTIDPESRTESGYYPVSVDENGCGVYAYLCTPEEVDAATDYDTALGMAAAEGNPASYTAQFIIYAEGVSEENAVTVSDLEELTAALQSGEAVQVLLTDDVALEESLTLAAGSDVTLDLNGYTLDTTATNAAFIAEEGSALTITGGTMTGVATADALKITGAEVTLSNVVLEDYKVGLRITDATGTGMDSTVRLMNCQIEGATAAILLYGNGSLSEQTTKVLIEGCTLTSDYIAVSGNGNSSDPGSWGTDVQISDCTITGKYAGIYHPQMEGVLNIQNSTITGITGIALKGGSMTIADSTVNGIGTEDEVQEPALTKSGFSDTGDAIYIETGYGYDISLEMNGEMTLTTVAGLPLRIFEEGTEFVTYINNSTFVDAEETAEE